MYLVVADDYVTDELSYGTEKSMMCRHRVLGCLMAAAGFMAPSLAAAQKPVIIYEAANWKPDSGVITARSPDILYGTATDSNAAYPGAVFEIDLKTGVYSTLHAFDTKSAYAPSGLILGPDGQLYGVVAGGPQSTFGAIFRMNAATGNATILYRFPTGPGGMIINGGALAVDPGGVIYGTTVYGGTSNVGSVFKFDPATGLYTTLYSFAPANDCYYPDLALVFNAGYTTLFGTTSASNGFGNGSGCVFSIDPQTGAEAVVAYSGSQGITGIPLGLAFDSTGQLFVAADDEGNGNGQVFSIDPASGAVSLIYRFAGGADGSQPSGGMSFGQDGVLYGATKYGGGPRNSGTVYRLDVASGTHTVLASFSRRKNTSYPEGSIVVDKKGDVFGAGLAAIYEVKPKK